MSVSSGPLWVGGPRRCMLHRGPRAGVRGYGTSNNRQGVPEPAGCLHSRISADRHKPQDCLPYNQPPYRATTRRSPAEWKHRRRKTLLQAASAVNTPTFLSGQAVSVCSSRTLRPMQQAYQIGRHSHCQHQLDRRRLPASQISASDSSNAASSDDHPASVPSWSEAAAPEPPDYPPSVRFAIDRDLEVEENDQEPQPSEAGILPEGRLPSGQAKQTWPLRTSPTPKLRDVASTISTQYASKAGLIYSPAQRSQIKESWSSLMRWSRVLRGRVSNGECALERIDKVVVFGGGSFGTAMAAVLARQKADLQVVLLLRDPYICHSINHEHHNARYLEGYQLPINLMATTSMAEAITGAQYAVHALPVQQTRAFLTSIKDVLPPEVPLISVSKGLELGTGKMMSEIIPAALGRKHPAVFLSGPSFAREVMDLRPTGIVAASKDLRLAKEVQQLFASPTMRVNTTSDVIGVELCGSLKNVLAIAAGIVEGLDLGHNAMAALVTQGCSEIRWLAEKAGANSATISGLSGLGDIMLTCYGSLSRNRAVGVKLGQGASLDDILKSSKQVAEGVSTAGVVVGLGRKYKVSLPVLTAVAQVLNSSLRADQAVAEIMNFPQIEER